MSTIKPDKDPLFLKINLCYKPKQDCLPLIEYFAVYLTLHTKEKEIQFKKKFPKLISTLKTKRKNYEQAKL